MPDTENLTKKRQKVLEKMLVLAAENGWNDSVLADSVVASGLDENYRAVLFPLGLEDAINLYISGVNEEMVKNAENLNLAELKIRERIHTLVMLRLQIYGRNKAAISKLIAYFARPFNLDDGIAKLAGSVDIIWRLAGDKSTDFNYYTKRALLAGVFVTTLNFWLHNNNDQEVSEFLKRRIEEVMQIQKIKAKIREFSESLPFPKFGG
jgi:ubiquinone biosynthesis protein COQ9